MTTDIVVACSRRDIFAQYRLGRRTERLPIAGWDGRGRAVVVNRRGVLVLATKARPSSPAGPLRFDGVHAGHVREPVRT